MDKKSVILDALARKQVPFSLSELQEAIEHKIPPCTLTRLLKALANEKKITLTGGLRNRKYLLNSPTESKGVSTPVLPAKTQSRGIIFSSASLAICQKLKVPIYTREPCTYNETWLMSYIPNESFYLSKTQREILIESGSQTINNQPAGTYANKIYDRLLIDLSYNSSRLEGNTYSLLDTQKLLLEGKAAEDKIDSDRVMILNHKEAIRYLVKRIEQIDINEEV